MDMKKTSFILFLFLHSVSLLLAQPADSLRSKPKLVFDLPVFDFPYQFDAAKTVNSGKLNVGSFFQGYANPGMQQSLNVANNLLSGVHYGVMKWAEIPYKSNKPSWKKKVSHYWRLFLGGLIFDATILPYTPGCDGWEHEEYHRAVMSRFHINSFNDMNKFPWGAEIVNVSHVSDGDLTRFKKESPSDFVRMQSAGIEGEYLLIDKMERNNFYYDLKLPHQMHYLFTTINSIAYVKICSTNLANTLTDTENAKETTIKPRDFSGLDFDGWVYDLFRPNEPYIARGTHPSGTGINRYIKPSNLRPEELAYLKKQGNLQFLNLLSPMLIGFDVIKLSKNGLYGNIAFRDYLTSFGNDISCNIFLKNNNYNFMGALHCAQNYMHTFPAIETQLIDYKINTRHITLLCSPRIMAGVQPLHQDFKTTKASFLGLAECKMELQSKSIFHPYVELSAKTKGWVAGNVYLDSNISCRFGIMARF